MQQHALDLQVLDRVFESRCTTNQARGIVADFLDARPAEDLPPAQFTYGEIDTVSLNMLE